MRVDLPHRLDAEGVAALARALRGAVEPVVLVGACTGMDPCARGLDDDAPWDALRDVFAALHEGPPTAALVTGPTAGGGVGLVAACDRVLATAGATFALPELLFGLLPAAILPALRSRIGTGGVRLLAMGATAVGVAEARRIGLVDRVVEDDRGIERGLARLDPTAVVALRHLLAPNYLDQLAAGIAASRRRLPLAAPRLARWADGEAPWSG